MNTYTAGIVLVVGIIAMRVLLAWRRKRLMLRRWKSAGEALQAGNFAEAEKALRKCVSASPLWVPARISLGGVLAKQDKLDEAEKQLKMAAELQPRQPEGHIQLAVFYANCFNDRAQDAIASLSTALQCDPGLAEQVKDHLPLGGLRNEPNFQQLIADLPKAVEKE